MKKYAILISVLVMLFSISAFAGKITYSIDPTTATPEGATVVTKGDGETVILFNVASFEEGMVFTFTLDMKAKGDSISFPVNADMKIIGNKKHADVTFDPATVAFENLDDSVSSLVTVTLQSGNYDKTKKIKIKFKADSEKGKGLGKGAGVKIIITKSATYEEFLEIMKEELSKNDE